MMKDAKMSIVVIAVLFLAGFCSGRSPAAVRATEADLGGQVLAVFTEKCAACHDAARSKSKGKFGYVLDLPQLAANPKLIVPHQPAESKLFTLVSEGDMPPEEAKEEPLTLAEQNLVRAWIEAGAPPAQLGNALAVGAPAGGDIGPRSPSNRHGSLVVRSLSWLGRFHVMVVHFPIALLMLAALAEAWRMWRGGTDLAHTIRVCILLGAASALAAAVLGWTRVQFSAYTSDTSSLMSFHRWLGTGAGAIAILAAVYSERYRRQLSSAWTYRGTLLASALLVSVAAHFGGLIVHGENFLNW